MAKNFISWLSYYNYGKFNWDFVFPALRQQTSKSKESAGSAGSTGKSAGLLNRMVAAFLQLTCTSWTFFCVIFYLTRSFIKKTRGKKCRMYRRWSEPAWTLGFPPCTFFIRSTGKCRKYRSNPPVPKYFVGSNTGNCHWQHFSCVNENISVNSSSMMISGTTLQNSSRFPAVFYFSRGPAWLRKNFCAGKNRCPPWPANR